MTENQYDMLKTLMDSYKRECEHSNNEEWSDLFGKLHGVIFDYLRKTKKI